MLRTLSSSTIEIFWFQMYTVLTCTLLFGGIKQNYDRTHFCQKSYCVCLCMCFFLIGPRKFAAHGVTDGVGGLCGDFCLLEWLKSVLDFCCILFSGVQPIGIAYIHSIHIHVRIEFVVLGRISFLYEMNGLAVLGLYICWIRTLVWLQALLNIW